MKTGLVYSLTSVLANPCIFNRYKVVYDATHTKIVHVERDVSWLRRLFGASKTEFKQYVRPADTVVLYEDTMHVHPHHREVLEQTRKGDCK